MQLPWDQIDKDLELYRNDQTLTRAIVSDDLLKINKELYEKQQLYSNYGYTEHNTKLWKTTNIDPKLTFAWESSICDQLPLDKAIATLTRQDPGQVLPWHRDAFYYLRNTNKDDARPIWRFLVFMEDWKIGHLVQTENSIYTNWKAGDTIIWQPETFHLSANAGLAPKWTCNITGFLTL
jgi:hypothetical protein